MLELKKWYKDPEFYKAFGDFILNVLCKVFDFIFTLEVAIRYLQWRGII